MAQITSTSASDGETQHICQESEDHDDVFEDEMEQVPNAGQRGYEPVTNLGSTPRPIRNDAFLVRFLAFLSLFLALVLLSMIGYIWNDPGGTMHSELVGSDVLHVPWKPLPPPEERLTKIAFGSCISQRMPQPHWWTIMEYSPDLLVLMGDNVYGDCREDSCEVLEQAYVDFVNHPSVQGAAPHLSVFATLDDHDYGLSNCHSDNPHKEIARDLFRRVFVSDEEQDAIPADGVYRARAFGPAGERVQIIMLDTRYSRSPFLSTAGKNGKDGAYYPPLSNDTTTPQQMLSEAQWAWLEDQLQESADLRLIISSVQVLNDMTGFECWRHLPRERQRLFDLLEQQENPASIILLSGDRHVGGFYESENGRIQEITASSFTHSFPLAAIHPDCTPEACDEKDPRRIGPLVHENHWGSLDIDWEHRNFTIQLRRSDSSYGAPYFEHLAHKQGDAGLLLQSRSYHF